MAFSVEVNISFSSQFSLHPFRHIFLFPPLEYINLHNDTFRESMEAGGYGNCMWEYLTQAV